MKIKFIMKKQLWKQSNFDPANNTDLELVCDEITENVSTK